MVEICADEPALFLSGGIIFSITRLGLFLVMVIVAPLREVVCEFKAQRVGGSIFEVDDYELFMSVCW